MRDSSPRAIGDFDALAQRRLIAALVETILVHAGELTDLDRAIGDGDHGINLSRGFSAVARNLDELAAQPPGPAFKSLGKLLVLNVGGASGPLFGTFFMALGDALAQHDTLARTSVVDACEIAVAAVRARGRSDIGQKTLVDVLDAVQAQLRAGGDRLLERLSAAAQTAADATTAMRAQRGRAAFLGDRSIGHQDPGARSTELLIAAACASLGTDRNAGR